MPQISYYATAPSLSDKDIFRTFMRTVPSDDLSSLAIHEVLKHFRWKYTGMIYTESKFGQGVARAMGEVSVPTCGVWRWGVAREQLWAETKAASGKGS